MNNWDLALGLPFRHRTRGGSRTAKEADLEASLPGAAPSGSSVANWVQFSLSVGISGGHERARDRSATGAREAFGRTTVLERRNGNPSEPSPDCGDPVSIRLEALPVEMSRLYAALEGRIPGWIDCARKRSEGDAAGAYTLGITSAVPGEGKTTVALHLASNIARSTFNKVCLIDLSLGEDALARRLGITPPQHGVATLLEEQDHVVQALELSDGEGPVLMLAGKAPANPARVARSPRVGELIGAARQMFDVVIVELPAVLTDNALPLASHLDGLVMVARAGATPDHVVNDALDHLGRTRLLGLVLNGVRSSSPKWFQKRLLGC